MNTVGLLTYQNFLEMQDCTRKFRYIIVLHACVIDFLTKFARVLEFKQLEKNLSKNKRDKSKKFQNFVYEARLFFVWKQKYISWKPLFVCFFYLLGDGLDGFAQSGECVDITLQKYDIRQFVRI